MNGDRPPTPEGYVSAIRYRKCPLLENSVGTCIHGYPLPEILYHTGVRSSFQEAVDYVNEMHSENNSVDNIVKQIRLQGQGIDEQEIEKLISLVYKIFTK